MTTASRLQRSSVSFRRQGSSGRIWNDPLRTLDLKQGPSPTAAAALVSPLAPSPRAAALPSASLSSPRSFHCHHGSSVGGGGGGDGGIPESPDVTDHSPALAAAAAAAAEPVIVGGGGGGGVDEAAGAPPERRNRRRRRLSSAFCACMGHPPASHAQQ